MNRRLAVLLAGVLVGGLGVVCAAQARPTAPVDARSWSDDASLLVTARTGPAPGLDLAFDFGYRGAPGHVTIYVPKGFDIYPARSLGLPVGVAEIEAANSSYGSFSAASFLGQIQADAVGSPLAAAAQACAPGTYAALWKLSLTILGQTVEAPISIVPSGSGDPADSAFRVDFCPPRVPGPDPTAAPLLPVQSLDVLLSFVPAPTRPGAYVWHTVVTPLAPDDRTLLSAQAYELRSTVPVPHRLTLTGHRSKGGVAVLSGRLTSDGRPQPHAELTVTRLVRKILPGGGVAFLDSIAGVTRTDGRGAYSLHVPLRVTSGFVASVDDQYGRCTGPALAPAGCVTATTAGTTSVPITLSVSKPPK